MNISLTCILELATAKLWHRRIPTNLGLLRKFPPQRAGILKVINTCCTKPFDDCLIKLSNDFISEAI